MRTDPVQPPNRPNRPPPPSGPRTQMSPHSLEHPPVVPVIGVLAVLSFVAVCFFLGDADLMRIADTGRAIDFNTIGYVTGCFVAVLSLYVFLVSDNKARATLRYADWSPIGARSTVGYLTAASWIMGAAHMYFWALDLTRP